MLTFESVRLRNWKNFGNATVSFSDRLFVVGANASGKSNLLDAFRFLKDITENGIRKAVMARGGIKKLRNLNARKPSYIEIFVQLFDPENGDRWTYRLQINAAGTNDNGDIMVALERITHNDEVVLDRSHADPGEDELTVQFTRLEQPSVNAGYRALFDCFRRISYVSIVPQLIRDSDRFVPVRESDDFYGYDLLEKIAATPKYRRDKMLANITRVLQMAVPRFSDLQFTQDERGRPHLQVRYGHFRPP